MSTSLVHVHISTHLSPLYLWVRMISVLLLYNNNVPVYTRQQLHEEMIAYILKEFKCYEVWCFGCRGSVAEHWVAQARGLLDPTPSDCWPFLYLRLITFKFLCYHREARSSETDCLLSSDQCSFPVFCCEKPLEEQEASLEYSTDEEEGKDHNFGQVRGCNCNS